MKRFLLIVLSFALIPIYSSIAFADQVADQETNQNEVVRTLEETDNIEDIKINAGITPDSYLYPIERLLESVQVVLTFTDEGKAELLIEFASKRLAEAEIMTYEDKLDLAEKVLKDYTKTIKKANKKAAKAYKKDKDITAVIEKIEVVQDNAGKIIIKTIGVISEKLTEQLVEEITIETKKFIVLKAFSTAKNNFFDAKKKFETAKKEYKRAKKSGDEAATEKALENLQLAEQYKDEMEQLKDEVEEYKEQVKNELEQEKDELEEQREKTEKAEKEIEKQQEKAEKRAEKAREKAEKELKKQRDKKDNDDDDDD